MPPGQIALVFPIPQQQPPPDGGGIRSSIRGWRLVQHLGTSILAPGSVSGRIIRRFLWSGFALLAASLLGMDLYVARHSAELWRPLLGVTLAVLLLAGVLAFLFIRSFSLRVAQIRAYAERLLDPPVFDQPLPAGEDDLGLLARSLQRIREEVLSGPTTGG